MNTFKVPPTRRFVQQSRPLDFIYDPVYTVPSRVDFFKNADYATRLGLRNRLQLQPNYKRMFSDSRQGQHVRACLPISPQDNFMEKFLPDYNISGIPVSPMDYCGDRPDLQKDDDVTGAGRAKYFIKYSQNMTEGFVGVHLAPQITMDGMRRTSQERKRTRSEVGSGDTKPSYKTRGTQTDFREEETQTDPYSPPYTLSNEAYPKILALVKMTWGKGLPATLDDIVTIERALTRRLLEMSDREENRSQTSSAEFQKRVKLMEKLEAQQWADREKDLEKIKLMKIELISKQLQEMKVKMANDQTHRLEMLFETQKRQNAKKLQTIKMNYLRQLRKLERKYRMGKKTFKRDIILDYIDMESSIYAPLVRNGPNIDQLNVAPEYQFTVHHDLETLTYLTDMDSFIDKHLRFDLKGFRNRVQKIQPSRATQNIERQLEDCFETFKDVCSPKKEADDEHEMLNSMIMKSVRRLSTPEEAAICQDDDDEDEAIILLQTLIRGRAVQSILRQEAENNMDTILQLKAAHEKDPFGALQPLSEKLAIRQQQRERDALMNQAQEESELSDQVEGEILAHMMSFLEKEMIRLLDERKIHALILLAERERRMLEAAEGGRRQKEEECQRANDEIWRHITGVHQQTVDMYLEDIYLESINRAADEGGRKYIQELAKTVNEAAYLMEKNIKDYDKDEIAADLVHSFLLPQVKRENVQRQMADLHGRYYTVATQVTNAVLNSKGIVQSVLDTIGSELPSSLGDGSSAVNASYCSVDEIIHQAVQVALKDVEKPSASEPPPPPSSDKQDDNKLIKTAKKHKKPKVVDKVDSPKILFLSKERLTSSEKTTVTTEEQKLEETKKMKQKKKEVKKCRKRSDDNNEEEEEDEEESSSHLPLCPSEDRASNTSKSSSSIGSETKGIGKPEMPGRENRVLSLDEGKVGMQLVPTQSNINLLENVTSGDDELMKHIASKQEQLEAKELIRKSKNKIIDRKKLPPSSAEPEENKNEEDVLREKEKSEVEESEYFKTESASRSIPIHVDPALSDLISVKSLGLKQGVETGETAVKMFEAACVAVGDIFESFEKNMVCTDDEYEDEELDDFDDEEQS